MKKSLIKNVTSAFLTLSLIALFSVSCSSSDDSDDPEVVFTSMEASKVDAYTPETITITLNGSGFEETNLTTSNPSIKINKVASTVYELSSTQAAFATVYAELKNKTHNQTKSINLTFVEHGIKDSKTVEGITVNVDNSAKVLRFLGEPDKKADSASGISETWSYAAKGLSIYVNKTTLVIEQIDIMSSGYSFTNKENVKVNYINYPYELSYGWKINETTMDKVVEKLGDPSTKKTLDGSTIKTYTYSTSNPKTGFRFSSDTEDNYTGKKIISFFIY